MAKQEIRSSVNIGSSSLVLIFIVLCLGTFGLLSLASAGNDLELARRNAAAVSGYYEADAKGADFLLAASEKLTQVKGKSQKEVMAYLQNSLSGVKTAENRLMQEIPMANGQALYLELAIDENGINGMEILQWKVYHQIEYEIDHSLPVWTGE